ncbi:hypothetical protein [Leptolyngbya sp. 7M]|uniref:hypothetical protein n=1 Tax=Leptolyngbya sp. 7M TaxID=2812896 RepID=UPI001B8D5F11|nr:hypothetical protein [Leptolyngbya sp. 7M]QYO64285.1 hypothetical protein JVX88_31960 [Leptolyngbya sp. 7M]
MFVIYEPGVVTPWDYLQTVRFYGFITDLRLKVDIESIAEKELPDLSVTQSRTERLSALRDMEWSGPRKQIGLYLETSGHPITHIASIALLNRLPYYHVNLMSYFTDNAVVQIANDARILAMIEDVGFGLLQGSDEVVIFGSVKEEVTTLPEDERRIEFCQSYNFTVGTQSLQLLSANSQRLQATFVNRHSSAQVFLNYGNTATSGAGICLLPNGGSYEINRTNPYQGVISAISSAAGATLSVMECV